MTSEEKNERNRAVKRLARAVKLKSEALARLEARRGCHDENELIHNLTVLQNRIRRIAWTISAYD